MHTPRRKMRRRSYAEHRAMWRALVQEWNDMHEPKQSNSKPPLPNLMVRVSDETLDVLLNMAELAGTDVCSLARQLLEAAAHSHQQNICGSQ
jgi:hypothetical protein